MPVKDFGACNSENPELGCLCGRSTTFSIHGAETQSEHG